MRTRAPLTSEESLHQIRRERAKRNKDRAKAMEQRIARILRGKRIPLSGAMRMYKGDVEIPLRLPDKKYIIECKLSAGRTGSNDSSIRIQFTWLEKIRKEAVAMNALFGVLIIHFFQRNNADFVFIHESTLRVLHKYMQSEEVYTRIQTLWDTAPLHDWRFKGAMIPTRGKNVLLSQLQNPLKVHTSDGIYMIISLATFVEINEQL